MRLNNKRYCSWRHRHSGTSFRVCILSVFKVERHGGPTKQQQLWRHIIYRRHKNVAIWLAVSGPKRGEVVAIYRTLYPAHCSVDRPTIRSLVHSPAKSIRSAWPHAVTAVLINHLYRPIVYCIMYEFVMNRMWACIIPFRFAFWTEGKARCFSRRGFFSVWRNRSSLTVPLSFFIDVSISKK